MKLRDIVVEDAIITNLAASSRDEAVRELVDALVAAAAISQKKRDEFVKSVLDRENRASTGLGHGVAVPHVKHQAVEDLHIAVGISRRGVEFNALDKKPVYSIFLLVSPADRPEDHLDAMQALFNNLNEPTFRAFLRQAKEVDDVLTLLSEADDRQLVR